MPTYEPDETRLMRIRQSMTNITPTEEQVERIEKIREGAKDMARFIMVFTPPGREQSLALTHLEETVMWGVKAIVLEGAVR